MLSRTDALRYVLRFWAEAVGVEPSKLKLTKECGTSMLPGAQSLDPNLAPVHLAHVVEHLLKAKVPGDRSL